MIIIFIIDRPKYMQKLVRVKLRTHTLTTRYGQTTQLTSTTSRDAPKYPLTMLVQYGGKSLTMPSDQSECVLTIWRQMFDQWEKILTILRICLTNSREGDGFDHLKVIVNKILVQQLIFISVFYVKVWQFLKLKWI